MIVDQRAKNICWSMHHIGMLMNGIKKLVDQRLHFGGWSLWSMNSMINLLKLKKRLPNRKFSWERKNHEKKINEKNSWKKYFMKIFFEQTIVWKRNLSINLSGKQFFVWKKKHVKICNDLGRGIDIHDILISALFNLQIAQKRKKSKVWQDQPITWLTDQQTNTVIW